MHTPTPVELLEVWERGAGVSAAARGVLLLESDDNAEEAANLPLGQRDARLLRLRARLFGQDIEATAQCPRCATTVEAVFRCDDLLVTTPSGAGADTGEHRVAAQGVRVAFRLPSSADLLALESCGDAPTARATLLERCVLSADSGGTPCDPHALPESAQAAIAEAMAQLDPQADLQLSFHCPECDTAWQPVFDIAAYMWQELNAWVLRLLRDVDTLAQAYHWSEAEILALSPRRRQAYLELCAP